MNTKLINIIIIVIFLLIVGGIFYLLFYPWKICNCVYLQDYNVSVDRKTVSIDAVNMQSLGYLKKSKVLENKKGQVTLVFYMSYLSLKKSNGLVYTCEIPLDNNMSEIYFYRENNNSDKMLYKDINGIWKKYN